MNLSDMRGRLRKDLHDEDSANQRWMCRSSPPAVQRWLAESPLSTTAGSRDLSIAGLTDLVAVEAVEYPTGDYPPTYVPYSVWLSTLTMLIAPAPGGVESVTLSYTQLPTLDSTSSTLPSR